MLVAGSAAYFSVLGIATLFSGSYYQVMIMAGALEFGKVIGTSFLYRYWIKTTWWLRAYLTTSILILMAITSLGIFGYLTAAYQVNSSKFAGIDSQITLIEQQKVSLNTEITQINARVGTLNESRESQEERLPSMSRQAAAPIYADIERSATEIKDLTSRTQSLQTLKFEKDNEILKLKAEISKAKDIGTFKFIAEQANKPLDSIVVWFICILIAVFDPLAVALLLCYNIASTGSIVKDEEVEKEIEPEKEEDTPKVKIKEKVLEKSLNSRLNVIDRDTSIG
jgi:hypothetical protein